MTTSTLLARLRTTDLGPRLGAALVGGVGVSVFALGFLDEKLDEHMVLIAGMLGAAALGLRSHSLFWQLLARGTALLVLVPWLALAMVERGVGVLLGLGALTIGAGLWLAHPALRTPQARERFAPARFREGFLVSATLLASGAVLASGVGIVGVLYRDGQGSLHALGMACGLLGGLVGILRMRAWGPIVAGLTSCAAVVAAVAAPDPIFGVGLHALAAIAGFLVWVPVIASWVVPARTLSAGGEALPSDP